MSFNLNSKTPEKLSLVTLVTNCRKLPLIPLVVKPWIKFEKKLVLILNLVISTSNKLYFRSLHKRFKCCSIGFLILMSVSEIFELASHCLVYSNH